MGRRYQGVGAHPGLGPVDIQVSHPLAATRPMTEAKRGSGFNMPQYICPTGAGTAVAP